MSGVNQLHVGALRCPYCHDSVAGPGPKRGCENCLAWSHQACLEELGRCANCEAPTETARPAQFPRSPAISGELLEVIEEHVKNLCTTQGCRALGTHDVIGALQCRAHATESLSSLSKLGWALLLCSLLFGPPMFADAHGAFEIAVTLVLMSSIFVLGNVLRLKGKRGREELRAQEAKLPRTTRSKTSKLPNGSRVRP